MSWQDAMNAIQSAFAAAAQLDPTAVVWAWQNIPQPATPYVKLSMPSITTKGIDWLSRTVDLTRPAGQEVKAQAVGNREVPIEMQVFTDSVADGVAAPFLAEQIKTGLLLPNIRSILTAVGISPFDPGPVQNVPMIVAANFRGRATCTIRCYMPAQALAEYYGYIETVNGTITSTGGASETPYVQPFSVDLE